MTVLIFYKKSSTSEGDIIEQKVWKIPESKDFPEGIKYRLVYIHKNKKVMGYDNEKNKEHHRHYFNGEYKYVFISPNILLADFRKDIERVKKDLYGNQKS